MVIFHDCDNAHPGVQQVVSIAREDYNWRMAAQVDSTVVFKRIGGFSE
jgi:hypothetical protein